MSERVVITQLKPGMVIVKITEQNGPVKIKKSGLVTSEDMIRGLSEMGVAEVEIDPEQTVELETETQEQTTSGATQTQALLKGQYDRQGHYDNQLADQFNRNLFLPSVQGIPSMWMVYLRQAAVILLTVLLGAGIGFAGATYSTWWPEKSEPVVAQAVSEPEPASSEPSLPEAQTQPASLQPEEEEAPQVVAQVEPQPVASQLVEEPEPEIDISEGIPLMQQQDTDTSQVSPELLRRFNQAIEDLDREGGEPQPKPTVSVRDRSDVQRIDQLPVRLMTTLPTMEFSAHMYASRPRDRWVRVNGQRLQEGDWIDNKVQIVNIEAQRVILDYQGEVFSMAALTDW